MSFVNDIEASSPVKAGKEVLCPCIVYTGPSLVSDAVVGTNGHNYERLLPNVPRSIVNLEDIDWFLHPERQNVITMVINRVFFSEKKLRQMQKTLPLALAKVKEFGAQDITGNGNLLVPPPSKVVAKVEVKETKAQEKARLKKEAQAAKTEVKVDAESNT